MQRIGERLLFSPSDLNHFLECAHLTQLELERDPGSPRRERDPQAELLAEKGAEHERAWLERFRAEGRDIVSIDSAGAERAWLADAERTRDAMRRGAAVIYQGVFVDGDWRGISDFLVRVERPSDLGAWSYEAWDTKLARRSKPYFVLQLCFYTEQLARSQGITPEHMVIVLGTGQRERLRFRDFDAYYRAVRDHFLAEVKARRPTYPYPVEHCGLCGYQRDCERRWQEDDRLSLVASIRRDQVERLNAIGVEAVAGLATIDPARRIVIGEVALRRLQQQAALQAEFNLTGRHRYELLRLDERTGFRLLPQPSDGDVFFDMEGDPYFEPRRGLEYLFGVMTIDTGKACFEARQALDRNAEKAAFEWFIDFLHDRLRHWPDLHVYHYASYETAALKRLMGEHATREEELDDLLRREVFVDLYQVVRQSLRVSHQVVASSGSSGAGIRYIPVSHEGNAQASLEEANTIRREVELLLAGGTFTDVEGTTRLLTPADILVVAPYNMQVRCLRERLPDGIDVGTVDKFQGREAPVVFFSMASSSGDDVPRGLEFLFSRNRLNVAISRARALAVVVCSPALLHARCNTLEQIRLVNNLCRVADDSRTTAQIVG